LILTILVFLVVLLPRLPGLGIFITWDEPQWAFRAAKFLHALETRHPAGTFLIGAPGVITMWCGAIGMAIRRVLSPDIASAWMQIIAQPSLDLHDVVTLRAISRFLVAAKIPLVILTSLGIAGIYRMTERLLRDRFAALLAALLIAYNPFFLAHSRVFHTDAPATVFVLLSLLTLFLALEQFYGTGDRREPEQKPRASQLLASGLLAGLAFLAKASTLPFVGIVGLLLAAPAIWPWSGLGSALRGVVRAVGQGTLWGIGAVLAFVVGWPAMWVDPLGTLGQMFGLARKFASTPHAQNFFLGEAVRNPGPLFYPVSLAFRTNPVVWVGLLAALVLVLRRPRYRSLVLALFAFALLYTLPLIVSAKKFERYALPVYPALDIVAAIGIAACSRWLTRWIRARVPRWPSTPWLVASAAIIPLAAVVVWYYPYYLAWGNPMLGGTTRAARVLPTGWGEGIDLAARYLNALPRADELRVAVWGVPGFGPLFRGESLVMDEAGLTQADYAVVYIGDVQMHSPLIDQFYPQATPVHTATIHGVAYAWVYKNWTFRPTEAALRRIVSPAERLVFDAPTRSARALATERAVSVIPSGDRLSRMVSALNRAARPGDRVAYVQYKGAASRGLVLQRMLDVSALRVAREEIPRATVWRYLAVDSFAVARADTPVDVSFGGQVRLAAVGLSSATLEDRRALGVTLRWQVLTKPAADFHIFIHLLDESGYRWGQWDGPLGPASGLRAGAVLTGTHLIRPLPGLPPGKYHLLVGLYNPASGERLPAQGQGVAAGAGFVIGPLVGKAPRLPRDPRELAIPHPMEWEVPGLKLLGFGAACASEEVAPCRLAEQRPGDRLPLTLFWQADGKRRPDYTLRLDLVDGKKSQPLQPARPVVLGHPTSRWFAREALRVPLWLSLPATLEGGTYTLSLELYDRRTGDLKGRRALVQVPVAEVVHNFSPPTPTHVVMATLGDVARLRGYDVQFAGADPRPITVTLYWQALSTPQESYTVFFHLTDAAGRIIRQHDAIPANGARPTTGWLGGEFIADQHAFDLPENASPGPYFLRVGLYQAETGVRLPAFDAQGKRLADDAIGIPIVYR
jgi:4-amino-4-deoxy-L-arabinose transferase-like glycosyltransferase